MKKTNSWAWWFKLHLSNLLMCQLYHSKSTDLVEQFEFFWSSSNYFSLFLIFTISNFLISVSWRILSKNGKKKLAIAVRSFTMLRKFLYWYLPKFSHDWGRTYMSQPEREKNVKVLKQDVFILDFPMLIYLGMIYSSN